jgi:hypothetical protein
VGRATGRQGERRHAEQQHEEDREAPLPEQVDQAPERLLAIAREPSPELVAEPFGRAAEPLAAAGGR